MGLRDRKDVVTRTFRMREKVFAVGDDYWIEDEAGNRVFKVNGKALRLRKTFVLEDPAGTEIARIREKKLSVRDTMLVDIGGHVSSSVSVSLVSGIGSPPRLTVVVNTRLRATSSTMSTT